jgi:hypothetical protein
MNAARSGTLPLGLLALVVVLAAAGYGYYVLASGAIQVGKSDELRAIADLKIGQISAWRKELAAHSSGRGRSNFGR